jgi:hypothetical protein
MFITDGDIESLLFNDDIKCFLEYISENQIKQKIILNVILFIFTSECVNRDAYYIDWVKEIITVLDELNTDILPPNLKQLHGIEFIFNEVVSKIYDLNVRKEIILNDNYITYEMFNEYINLLYEWFLENFES